MSKTITALLVVISLAVPSAVLAAAGIAKGGGLDRQLIVTGRTDVTTASETWEPLADLDADVACQDSSLAVGTVSLSFESGSAPVQVRVRAEPLSNLDAETLTAAPGAVAMSPVGADSRAFTFSTRLSGGGHGRRLVVEWRSRTGGPATVSARSLHILYDRSSAKCA
jgi:hypothetical protein